MPERWEREYTKDRNVECKIIPATTLRNFFNFNEVSLCVYDISHGHAQSWSPWIIGQKIEGIWHTGVEVYGREYFYGGGVFKIRPGNMASMLGLRPQCNIFMGATQLPKQNFERYVRSVAERFTPEKYNLLDWNCNHFSDILCRFLVNRGIPQQILTLPQIVQSCLRGRLILSCLQTINRRPMVATKCRYSSTPEPQHPADRRRVPWHHWCSKRTSLSRAQTSSLTSSSSLSSSSSSSSRTFTHYDEQGGGLKLSSTGSHSSSQFSYSDNEENLPSNTPAKLQGTARRSQAFQVVLPSLDLDGFLPVGCPGLSPGYPKPDRQQGSTSSICDAVFPILRYWSSSEKGDNDDEETCIQTRLPVDLHHSSNNKFFDTCTLNDDWLLTAIGPPKEE